MRRRIGIDFHVFDGKFQGSRTHILEILSRVVETSTEYDYYIFLENIEALRSQYPVFNSPNVFLVRMKHTNSINRLCHILPKLQKEKSLDLLHTQYITPILSLSPCVVTIHDILFETHPQYFTPLFRLRFKFLVRASAIRARHIFTVSEYCKQELVKRYRVNPKRISVIYNGVDHERFTPICTSEEVLNRRGLRSGEYLLSVGRLEPRKNYGNLLTVYSALGYAPPLVVVGQRDFRYQNLFKLISELGIEDKVKIIDDVDDFELPLIYRNARLFIYPSYAEGFGIPPLEAMASGVPVICSNTTAIPEVVGSAAFLVDPSSPEQLTNAIREVLSNKILSRQMSEDGILQSRLFTWEKAAEATINGYHNALSS